MKISESKLTYEQMLLTSALDDLNFLAWTKTKDAQKGINKPKPILEKILENDKDKYMSFGSVEELEQFFRQIDEV